MNNNSNNTSGLEEILSHLDDCELDKKSFLTFMQGADEVTENVPKTAEDGVENNVLYYKLDPVQAKFVIRPCEVQTVVPNIEYNCANCHTTFDEIGFAEHICKYDSDKFITINGPANKKKKDNVSNDVLQIVKQYRENNARIRKFLKDEYKIESGGSSKKDDGPHECNMCERKFVHSSGLTRHMEKHAMDLNVPVTGSTTKTKQKSKAVYNCMICGLIMFDARVGINHLQNVHAISRKSKIIGSCANCVLRFTDIDAEINNHQTMRINLKVFLVSSILQCEFCDFLFGKIPDLLAHTLKHDPQCGFRCNCCSISFKSAKEIFFHWQTECIQPNNKVIKSSCLKLSFACLVCHGLFNSLEQLYDHKYAQMHLPARWCQKLGKNTINCELCGILQDTPQAMVEHNSMAHPKKQHNDHSTKDRQYLCDVCGKSYTQSSHLWQHLRFHKGVKPFMCPEQNCTRRFTIRPDLNDHIRKCHTGERPYHCLVCGKRFLTGSVFYQHRLIHRGERRYGCDQCGKRFYRADALKNHQRIHTGEKPYNCIYCSKCFRQRGDRDKHIRARHASLDARARSLNDGNQPRNVVMVGDVALPLSMFQVQPIA